MTFIILHRQAMLILLGVDMILIVPPILLGVAVLGLDQVSHMISSSGVLAIAPIGGVLGLIQSLAWYRSNPRKKASLRDPVHDPRRDIRDFRTLPIGVGIFVASVFICVCRQSIWDRSRPVLRETFGPLNVDIIHLQAAGSANDASAKSVA